jgi:hypothetical protein
VRRVFSVKTAGEISPHTDDEEYRLCSSLDRSSQIALMFQKNCVRVGMSSSFVEFCSFTFCFLFFFYLNITTSTNLETKSM